MKNQDDRPVTFIIAGMHRSGTSLTSSLMESAGMNIGTRLMGADLGNEKGHFENLDFVQFHQRVLRSQGLSQEGWTLQPKISVPQQLCDEATLIIENNSISPCWGWKDPRTTLFLDFWEKLLPQAYFIFTYRAPWEVLDSLYRRGDEVFSNNPTYALDIWIYYNKLILDFCDRFPQKSILLNIESLFLDCNCITKLCQNKFGIEFKNPTESIIDKSLMSTLGAKSHKQLLIQSLFPEAITVFNKLNSQADLTFELSGLEQLGHDESFRDCVLQDWLELSKLKKQYKSVVAAMEQSQPELEYTQSELEQTQLKLQQARLQLENNHSQLQKANLELTRTYSTITWMETSKFWKLRLAWLKTRKKLKFSFHHLDTLLHNTTSVIERIAPDKSYCQWRKKNVPHTADLQKLAETVEILPQKPSISVIMPVFDTPESFLQDAIESVIGQIYPHWELCIADDASTKPHIRELLKFYQANDDRIKVVFRETNGHISNCSNSALGLATGDFVALLDHDDVLTPDALYEIALLVNRHPEADMIYSDEDKIDQSGRLSLPLFKPSWSPHLAISQNYLAHLMCYRRDRVVCIGGFREGVEGSQDYDLALRVAQSISCNSIYHIPKVLYHWRLHEGSTAQNANSKLYADSAGLLVINNYLKLRYPLLKLNAVNSDNLFTYRLKFDLSPDLLVSIIIPTKDKVELLQPCIQSILECSSWKNFEIIILNNNSQESLTYDFFREISQQDSRVIIVDAPIPFNWSKLNNLGTQKSSGEILVFLNNDTKVISSDWLESLAGYALLPDVGTVGGLLLYEDGTIQHSGVVVGMNSWADHVFKSLPLRHNCSPFISPVLTRNVLAVTGACLAIERCKLEQLGGFDEEFIICGSDVELGLRAHRNGLFNVMCAEARLYHFESKTRSDYVPEQDFIQSDLKYAPFRLDTIDPFYSPNLSLTATTPSMRS